MRDVFISNSSRDFAIAKSICEELEYEDISCWLKPRDIIDESNYNHEIGKGIHESLVVLFLYTEDSNESDLVLRQLRFAFNEKKKIIPIRMSDKPLRKELVPILEDVLWVDFDSEARNFDEILDELEKKLDEDDEMDTWSPVKISTKKLDIKKTAMYTGGLVVAVVIISYFFILSMGGLANYTPEQYIAVYLDIDDSRIRIEVNEDMDVTHLLYFDTSGEILISNLNYRNLTLSNTIYAIVERAINQGLMHDDSVILTNIRASHNVNEEWILQVNNELSNLRFSLGEYEVTY